MLGRVCSVGASAAMVLAFSRTVAAQPHVCSTSTVDSSTSGEAAWSPPLDRSITVRATNLSLRDALDRVATAARIRLSYSAEQVPVDRAVCVSADASPAGRILADLLAGTNVAAVVVGTDQVVLTPRPRPAHAEGPGMAPTVGVLDRVVVTGTASGAPAKELSVGLDVLNGRTLARENTNTISDALDSYVPGVWSWAQSPSNMLSSYASIRGASSFGLSYPKIYIDGIEVANPLLLSRFSPGAIDHIEVIRGPQGAALYGADAISGVVNIVTRHDGANGDGPQADIRSTAGVSQSAFTKNVVTQDHAFSLVTGTSTRSMDLNVSGSTMGAFVPNGYSRDIMASGGGRIVGNTGSLTTTARLFFEQAGVPSSPLIQNPASSPGGPPTTSTANSSPQTVTEYTFGATALRAPGATWVDSFVVGVDGYRLANVQTNYTPVPSIVDSALRAAQGGADRATLRASRVFHFKADDPTRGSITLSAEHATLRASTMMSSAFVSGSGSGNRGPGSQGDQDSRENLLTPLVTWQNSTGVTAQANAAINNALFFTSGVRLEEDSRLAPGDRLATLPMFGVAGVNGVGPFTMKLRAAYGRGIRPPSTTQRWQLWQPQTAQQAALGPEVQSGTEVGLDVMLRHALTLQLTRFDQRASGLIQQVPFASDSALTGRRMQYVAQNVGEISNAGWELGATSTLSRVTMNASFAAVDSRVRKLAPGYIGDLATGDRMLQVPAITASFGATWTGDAWSASMGGTRAFNWVNYDEVALAQTWLSGTESVHQMVGPELRNFWRKYTGGLHLRANVSHDIRRDFSVELSGDNLLNYQSGEPDNITIIPGRTIMTGVRVKF
jgi:iron complex outermembrane receptor protein